ncbi:hypothetical protein BDN71DRAFT_1433234 [Pleurotus eryngii]|uniref:Uncharacterized protein n=1 Tax=Pleurotus eryngii TaxID=5323 RepID=A0A9P6D4M5_PLEER|nr:hypothetical protein BDN71DRAFT_1433234 [Pleurotus eryngii]
MSKLLERFKNFYAHHWDLLLGQTYGDDNQFLDAESANGTSTAQPDGGVDAEPVSPIYLDNNTQRFSSYQQTLGQRRGGMRPNTKPIPNGIGNPHNSRPRLDTVYYKKKPSKMHDYMHEFALACFGHGTVSTGYNARGLVDIRRFLAELREHFEGACTIPDVRSRIWFRWPVRKPVDPRMDWWGVLVNLLIVSPSLSMSVQGLDSFTATMISSPLSAPLQVHTWDLLLFPVQASNSIAFGGARHVITINYIAGDAFLGPIYCGNNGGRQNINCIHRKRKKQCKYTSYISTTIKDERLLLYGPILMPVEQLHMAQ